MFWTSTVIETRCYYVLASELSDQDYWACKRQGVTVTPVQKGGSPS